MGLSGTGESQNGGQWAGYTANHAVFLSCYPARGIVHPYSSPQYRLTRVIFFTVTVLPAAIPSGFPAINGMLPPYEHLLICKNFLLRNIFSRPKFHIVTKKYSSRFLTNYGKPSKFHHYSPYLHSAN